MARVQLGVRMTLVILPGGTEHLFVTLYESNGAQERVLMEMAGSQVAGLRALLQKVEAEYPTLTGNDAAAKAATKTTILSGHAPEDPTRN